MSASRRNLQVFGALAAGVALAAVLLIGIHRPGSARAWTAAVSTALAIASHIRGEAVPITSTEVSGLFR